MRRKRMMMWSLLLIMGIVVSLQAVGSASSKGRRNTAAVLTGVTLYELLHGNMKSALILGAGSAVAWNQYDVARDRERREQRARSYSEYSGAYYVPSGYHFSTAY